jgi:hypothetical protein
MKFRNKKKFGMGYRHIPAHFEHWLHYQHYFYTNSFTQHVPVHRHWHHHSRVLLTHNVGYTAVQLLKSRNKKCKCLMLQQILITSSWAATFIRRRGGQITLPSTPSMVAMNFGELCKQQRKQKGNHECSSLLPFRVKSNLYLQYTKTLSTAIYD